MADFVLYITFFDFEVVFAATFFLTGVFFETVLIFGFASALRATFLRDTVLRAADLGFAAGVTLSLETASATDCARVLRLGLVFALAAVLGLVVVFTLGFAVVLRFTVVLGLATVLGFVTLVLDFVVVLTRGLAIRFADVFATVLTDRFAGAGLLVLAVFFVDVLAVWLGIIAVFPNQTHILPAIRRNSGGGFAR